jgi:hypothetical protein
MRKVEYGTNLRDLYGFLELHFSNTFSVEYQETGAVGVLPVLFVSVTIRSLVCEMIFKTIFLMIISRHCGGWKHPITFPYMFATSLH